MNSPIPNRGLRTRPSSVVDGGGRAARIQVSHGPMELGVQLEGEPLAIRKAGRQISEMTRSLLEEVHKYYPLLRLRAGELPLKDRWPRVVRRMIRAARAVSETELTPMAAVAGAVSDEILARIRESGEGRFTKILVNNGGDMALFSPYAPVRVAIRGAELDTESVREMVIPGQGEPYGVATSGWRGRSFSKGIADAVTVVANKGAIADAAATHIGNHVDASDLAGIVRRKASCLDPETDVPDLMVTVACGALTGEEKRRALDNGRDAARNLIEKGMIWGAGLYLQGDVVELEGRFINFQTIKEV